MLLKVIYIDLIEQLFGRIVKESVVKTTRPIQSHTHTVFVDVVVLTISIATYLFNSYSFHGNLCVPTINTFKTIIWPYT